MGNTQSFKQQQSAPAYEIISRSVRQQQGSLVSFCDSGIGQGICGPLNIRIEVSTTHPLVKLANTLDW